MNVKEIKDPTFLQRMDEKELQKLCGELREFIIESVSHTGGHLSSNLGLVELTLALHRVFHTRRIRCIFDVGHQCYTHKLLTGRAAEFDTLRCTDGLSGFQCRTESPATATRAAMPVRRFGGAGLCDGKGTQKGKKMR